MLEGTARLDDTTVGENRAGDDGGGIHAATGVARLRNSIVAENLAASSPQCVGDLLSDGWNLFEDASCPNAPGPGDLAGVAAKLSAPIAGVYATLAGSPARDTGSPETTGSLGPSCSRRDGLATMRPVDGDGDAAARCDIGAIETIGIAVLDVDGNGVVNTLTDGLLIMRYLSGFGGDSLTNGAVAFEAPRSSSGAVLQYLASIESTLDADGDGAGNALTDGVLILRYMFGMTGALLTEGAIGAGATRSTADAVIAYLDLIARPTP